MVCQRVSDLTFALLHCTYTSPSDLASVLCALLSRLQSSISDLVTSGPELSLLVSGSVFTGCRYFSGAGDFSIKSSRKSVSSPPNSSSTLEDSSLAGSLVELERLIYDIIRLCFICKLPRSTYPRVVRGLDFCARTLIIGIKYVVVVTNLFHGKQTIPTRCIRAGNSVPTGTLNTAVGLITGSRGRRCLRWILRLVAEDPAGKLHLAETRPVSVWYGRSVAVVSRLSWWEMNRRDINTAEWSAV